MMYPYLQFEDETLVTHSNLLNEDTTPTVIVHFEKPTEDGFLSARCRLPDYQWEFNKGYTPNEILFFEEFLHYNAHLLFRYAKAGGVSCA